MEEIKIATGLDLAFDNANVWEAIYVVLYREPYLGTLDTEVLFKEVMKETKGAFNPMFLKKKIQELKDYSGRNYK